jgi:hypothetical protein
MPLSGAEEGVFLGAENAEVPSLGIAIKDGVV